jgi:hypothetical protein
MRTANSSMGRSTPKNRLRRRRADEKAACLAAAQAAAAYLAVAQAAGMECSDWIRAALNAAVVRQIRHKRARKEPETEKKANEERLEDM